MDTTILLWVLAVSLILTGLAGIVLPLLPGAPLLFLGLVIAAWTEDFVYVGYGTLAALAALAVLIYIVDFLAGILGAKHFGASPRAMIGAGIGAVIGLFLGFVGIIIGPFIGAVIGELSVRRELTAAGMAGLGTTIGLLLGVAAKIAIGLTMVGIFVLVRFF
jgi:uncharacterized protein YqgC (DUF456 family)